MENEKAKRNAVSRRLALKVMEGSKSSIRDTTGDHFWYTVGNNLAAFGLCSSDFERNQIQKQQSNSVGVGNLKIGEDWASVGVATHCSYSDLL